MTLTPLIRAIVGQIADRIPQFKVRVFVSAVLGGTAS